MQATASDPAPPPHRPWGMVGSSDPGGRRLGADTEGQGWGWGHLKVCREPGRGWIASSGFLDPGGGRDRLPRSFWWRLQSVLLRIERNRHAEVPSFSRVVHKTALCGMNGMAHHSPFIDGDTEVP